MATDILRPAETLRTGQHAPSGKGKLMIPFVVSLSNHERNQLKRDGICNPVPTVLGLPIS